MNLKLLLVLSLLASVASAHFGVVIPSNSTIDDPSQAKEKITYKFTHPFEGMMMNLDKPIEAGVFVNGKKEIISNLVEKKDGKMSYYEAEYNVKNPGIYQFYMDPKPYFEPAENIFIRHITKTVVDAYGYGEGWDEQIGLKTEIIPLTRPYALYKGNIFSGKVLYKGKPAKNSIVEVEYLNLKGLKAPGEDYITQEVKTNEFGEFSFAMPLAGWWGFSALSQDDEKIKKDGKDYPVEIGAVIWVETKGYK
ncbi:DUF4198 domain-containing protein [Campylobacter hyointestinalis]|uniref:DUF4198 domain-containing protein n=1 Tax=Campylobacter hyointestinalis TaxID=198 RepID=UPI000CE2EED8|nr:DUF4198 domain-containing protein [Campylobacter hyointestinalis]PPB69144.1 hypothetical protein CDQ76_00395 [Campylobacter hyointestinalis subsp. hyointestinalis]